MQRRTPVCLPAIKNAALFTRTYQGTSLHFTERQLDSFAEQLRFYLMIFNITTRHCADECIITKKSHFKTKIYYSTWYTSNLC